MNKKILLLLILLLSSTIYLQAQTVKFRFGLNAIPSITWLSTETEGLVRDGTDFNFGYGLLTEYLFTENYAFSSGLFIIGTGGSLDFPSGDDSVYYKIDDTKFYLLNRNYNLNYVTLPLTLKLRTGQIGYMTYYGQFGVNIGFRARAKSTDMGVFEGISATSTQENVDLGKDASLAKMGLNVGLGTEYNISGRTSLMVGLNYHNGFTNVLKHKSNELKNESGSPFLQKASAHGISLTVGVIF